MAKRAMLSAWSRTGVTRVQDVGDTHAVRYSRRFGPQNHPAQWMAGFGEFGPENSEAAVPV
jgi:hypothetical protein